MLTILTYIQENWWILYAGGFGLAMFTILLVQLSLMRKVNRMQRKINAVTEKVGNYLTVIMASDPEQEEDAVSVRAEQERMRKEEEQNRIISSMLQEIFP